MDKALARVRGVRCIYCTELGPGTTDTEHRMCDQANFGLPLGNLAHHRIDQERHVVVDDLDHRHRIAVA